MRLHVVLTSLLFIALAFAGGRPTALARCDSHGFLAAEASSPCREAVDRLAEESEAEEEEEAARAACPPGEAASLGPRRLPGALFELAPHTLPCDRIAGPTRSRAPPFPPIA